MKSHVKILSCFDMKAQPDKDLYERAVCREVDEAKEQAGGTLIKLTWLSPSADVMHAIVEWVTDE